MSAPAKTLRRASWHPEREERRAGGIDPNFSIAEAVELVLNTAVAGGRRPLTLRSYRANLARFSAFMAEQGRVRLVDATAEDLLAYFARLQKEGLSPSSVRTYAISLRRLFSVAEAQRKLAGPNPLRQIDIPRENHELEPPFEKWEVEALLAACETGRNRGRDRAMLLVLLDTGLRVSEFAALCVGDIAASGRVAIRSGKGGRGRYVFISQPVMETLKLYWWSRGNPPASAPAWTSRNGGGMFPGATSALTSHGVYLWLQRLGKRAGVVDAHPHRLRKTFGVWYLENGGDILILSKIMGTGLAILQQHYLSMSTGALAKAHGKYSPVAALLAGDE